VQKKKKRDDGLLIDNLSLKRNTQGQTFIIDRAMIQEQNTLRVMRSWHIKKYENKKITWIQNSQMKMREKS
jgi:hypothetical protein